MASGLQLQVNYVWSKSFDNGSVTVTQGGDNDLPQDPDDPDAEWGLSNYDVATTSSRTGPGTCRGCRGRAHSSPADS